MTGPGLRPDPALLTAAIDWRVRLGPDLDRANPADTAAFVAWLAADEGHRQAWSTVEQALGASIEPTLARLRELQATHPVRADAIRLAARRLPTAPALARARRRSLAALGLGGVAALLYSLERERPLLALASDLATGTAERRELTLADSSRLTLNARTAVERRFDAGHRGIDLRAGAIAVDVAAGPALAFEILTAGGTAATREGRLVVERGEAGSRVAALAGQVDLLSRDGARRRLLADEVAWLGPTGIIAEAVPARSVAAWTQGLLDLADGTLGDLVDALRPYRRERLRITSRAGALRVAGVFPLDDSDRLLRILEQTLPIRVRRLGPLMTSIESRG